MEVFFIGWIILFGLAIVAAIVAMLYDAGAF